MTQSILILIVLSLFLGAGAWLVFLWAARRGQFDDVEGPKHRMLQDDLGGPEWDARPGRRRRDRRRKSGP